MRYRKLTIKNLLSIEAAEIDFEHGVLAGESLFLITGETGSGKSTILDAISLSLYGEAPRMSRIGYQERYTSDLDSELRVNDVRQLMRRHTGECETVLYFEGNDGKEYTASWSVRRARGKENGNLQSAVNTITELHTGNSVTKKAELREVLERAIGLTYEQFCRTSMLAQGEFTRFLLANPDEKAEILEKLTGTSIYSEIGKKIFEEKREKQTIYDRKKDELDGIKFLTEEEVASAREEQKKIEEELTVCNGELKQVERAKGLITGISQAADRIGELNGRIEMLTQQMSGEAFLADQQLVADYRRTADARIWYRQAEKSKIEVQELEKREKEYCRLFATALGERADALRQKSESDKRSEQLTEQRKQLEPYSEMYAQSALIHRELEGLAKSQATLNKNTQEAADLRREQTQLHETQKALLEEKTEEETKLAAMKAETQKLRTEIKQKEQETLISRMNEIVSSIAILSSLARIYTDRSKNEKKVQQLADDLKHQEEQLKENREKSAATEERERNAKSAYDTALWVSNEVVTNIRASLHKGDRCPVCGEVVQSHIGDHSVDVAVRPLKDAWETAHREHDELKQSILRGESEVKNMTEKIEGLRSELQWLDEELQQLGTSSGDPLPVDLDAVKVAQTRFESEKDKLIEQQKEIKHLNKQLEEWQEKEDSQNKTLKSLAKRESDLAVQLEKKVERISMVAQKIDENAAAIMENKEMLTSMISYDDVEVLLEGDLLTLWERISKEAEKFRSIDEELHTLQEKGKQIDDDTASIEVVLSDLLQAHPTWSEVELSPSEYGSESLQKWRKLSADVDSWGKDILREKNQLAKYESDLTTALSSFSDIDRPRLIELSKYEVGEIDEIDRKLTKTRTDKLNLDGQLREATAAKDKMEQEKEEQGITASMEDLVEMSGTLEVKVNGFISEQAKLQLRLAEDEEHKRTLATLREELDDLGSELTKWANLLELFGDSAGKKFRSIAQSYILSHLLRLANDDLQRFSDRYMLTCSPGSLAILVTDAERGFTPQSINVLSGGEGFMVSLALSLALSRMSASMQNLDMLFIDEGFGTLDAECLSTVMNTLETLSSGRRVGIISHVPELKERIPAQIQVKRVDMTRSVVTVTRSEGGRR